MAGSLKWVVWLMVGVLALPLCGLAIEKVRGSAVPRELPHTRWKASDFECTFGPPPQMRVTYGNSRFTGAYILDGNAIHGTAFGTTAEGSWDGQQLFLAGEQLEFLGADNEVFPAIPKQTFEPGTWHVLMAAQVAVGFIWEMSDVLKNHGVPDSHITFVGHLDSEPKDVQALRTFHRGEANGETINRELSRLAQTLRPNDAVLLIFASHMSTCSMCGVGISYDELDKRLAAFPYGTRTVVVLEGCNSGGGLPALRHADIAYAAVPDGEGSYGGFLLTFVHAFNRELFTEADRDKNGIVTFGEAFDVSCNTKHLEGFYRQPIGKRIPQRATRIPGSDYGLSLVPFAITIR